MTFRNIINVQENLGPFKYLTKTFKHNAVYDVGNDDDNNDDNVDDDNGDLSQSSFFLLPLGVLQRFFPLHSFLTFHLSISGDDGGDNIYDVDDNNDN